MKVFKDITKQMEEHKFHPLCILFPIPPERELLSMAERMKKSGQYYPILRLQSTQEIIDGRIRLILCLMAEIEPYFLDLDISSTEALVDIISLCNFDRRHMALGTKLEIGIEMEEWIRKEHGIAVQEDVNLRKIQELAQTKRTAREIHTTLKALNQFKELKKEAESNPEVRKALDQLERGRKEKSINRLYIKHLTTPKKKGKVTKQKVKTKLDLRQEIIDLKEELASVKTSKYHYETLYNEVKGIATKLGYWDEIANQITYIIENVMLKKDSSFPTIKQLREAGLL
ncbi:hypothetical protein LCGC14_0225250 [marine sediment metagenome]|uniref:ParB/Sulfiredoxin domain-containing protein n=1 Tax=marine sediment metagenome TaxID=412755 RepID=A0A0F9WX22_9ZZZZ